MRALRCVQLGELDDVVVVEDIPDPVPGPGQVMMRVGAAAANFPDVLLTQGKYQVRLEPPFTIGSEMAGTIVALGEGVTRWAVGDRVTGSAIAGAFAELAVVPDTICQPIPEGVPDDIAAAQGVTYVTSWHSLHTIGDLQAGQWVVVLGAAGGVGLAAVELAHLHGAKVIAAASGAEKLAACSSMGADAVVDYTTTDLKVAIKDITGGGADLVIDPVGGDWAEAAMRALRPGGRYVVVGFASGQIPSFPLNLLLVKGVSVHGMDMRHVGSDPVRHGRALKALAELLSTGQLKPYIGGRFSLEEGREALRVLADRKAVGKILVIP